MENQINEYALMLIKHKARQLVGNYGFTVSDREDLEQVMLLDLWERLPQFNATKATLNTFVTKVVNHQVATIIRERKNHKRKFGGKFVPPYQNFEPLDGYHGILDQLHVDRRTGQPQYNRPDLRDFNIDLAETLSRLSQPLRDLCERCKSDTTVQIAKDTGLHRVTIYRRLLKLRRIFTEAGLTDYLPKRTQPFPSAGVYI